MIDWRPWARQLADTLATTRGLDPEWYEAFAKTPRHVFVPRYWALDEYHHPAELVDGADPDQWSRWLEAVYADQVLITQWQPRGELRIVSSSASQPSIVAHMLQLLDLQPGQRVLEIGTGTGYNTALLCHYGAQVTSIDIDPVLVAEAQSRLARLGYHPTLVAGDGADGHPDNAPYDRILSTCAAHAVPPAWVDQLADGGLLVAPLTIGGALTVLRKTGGQLTGTLDAEQAYFMPLHPAGQPMPTWFTTDIPAPATCQHHTTTSVPLAAWADPDFRLWLALHRADWHLADTIDPHGNRTGIIVYTTDHRAHVDYTATSASGGAWLVQQDHTRLWDTIEAAWHTWQHHHQPHRSRIGITAHPNGHQWAWLDKPNGPIQWPLPHPGQGVDQKPSPGHAQRPSEPATIHSVG